MSIDPRLIEEGKKQARFHLQVEVIHDTWASERDFYPGTILNFRVRGIVKRIFKGDAALDIGDEVIFRLSVSKDLFLGTVSIRPWEMDKARFIEVFLDGEPPDCAVVMEGYSLIDELTDTPTEDVDLELAREGELVKHQVPLMTIRGGVVRRFKSKADNDE